MVLFKKSYLEDPFAKVVVQKSEPRIFSAVKRVNRTFVQIARLKKLYPKYGAWDRYVKVSV